jgi:hypothetical protein
MGQDGNVWQWNETAIGSSRGLRGGDWYDDSGILASSRRDGNAPTYEDHGIGFRVASSEAVPEPGSIILLIAGAIAVLIGWGRWR